MKLFAQIRKVDEAKRLVFGRAAEEIVDKADEIMDYASSKPYFQKWSADIAKDTEGKSLGNVRAMHGKVAAGKLVGIDFNDTDKAIDICAKVVDDGEWKKVLEGVYTGFSVGGAYVEGSKKVEKLDSKDVTRYTADPNEVSLVDRPCIPTSKFFEVQKADGTLAKVDFKEPAAEPELIVEGTAEEVGQLAKLMNEQGLTMAQVLAKIAAPAPAAAGADSTPAAAGADTVAAGGGTDTVAGGAAPDKIQKVDVGALRKSMWSCSYLADVISSLQSLKSSAEYEAFYEGDDSGIGKKLGACIAMCGQILIDMVKEEVAEAAAGTEAMALADKIRGLAKFEGDPIMALLKVGARNSAADQDRLAKIHDLAVELGHTCAAADKAAPAGELAKVDAPTLEKLVAAAVEPLQKAIADAAGLAKTQAARIEVLEKQPAPARVSLRAIAKSDDVPGAPEPKAAAPVKDDLGDVHEAAGLIKNLHQSGGAPLLKLS